MKTKTIYLISATFLLLISCDVLDQEPRTQVSNELAFSDLRSAEVALNGLYDQIQSVQYYGGFLQNLSDISSDVTQTTGISNDNREIDTYVVTPDNTAIGNFWNRAYTAINHANNIIFEVPRITDITPAKLDVILGQAYFIRGLVYFDLSRVFGGVPGMVGIAGVPIVTLPSRGIDESSFPARSSLADSYLQIESDLLEAYKKLPESFGSDFLDRSRVTKATVRAMLSRLYLYLKDYPKTIEFSTAVIQDNRFSLVSDFADIFDSEFTRESIFELNFSAADPNNMRSNYFPAALGGTSVLALHNEFVAVLTTRPEDKRALIEFDPDVSRLIYYPTKYNKLGGINNMHILRMAEMYLNRAEAYAGNGMITEGLADLNVILNRAGLESIEINTQIELALAIEKERLIEFMQEGHRWFDLMRTGRTVDVINNLTRLQSPGALLSLSNPDRQVFPIPTIEMDVNFNLVQNSAYR
ncbi:MAG: RagB/SusD family nutrient uptake outer membrane protein [Cyclobacteriaceae bacterium]|nr:RagB/SusD family nutrient uptake outer membrane protein [Cyclobacteriaceae bacterium]